MENVAAILERLTTLLQLQRRARLADINELPFVIVNETRTLLTYRQAALFLVRRGKPRLTAVSGVAVPEKSSPYSRWLTRFIFWQIKKSAPSGVQGLTLNEIFKSERKTPKWFTTGLENVAPFALQATLANNAGAIYAVIILFRETPFTEADATPFIHLAESYGQSLLLNLRGGNQPHKRRSYFLYLLAMIFAGVILSLPVPQTMLAPAEITAQRPALVRATLDGVIEKIFVAPNERVKHGDKLLSLDDTQLRTRLAIAKKTEEMAQVEYRQLQQAGLADPKTKARMPLMLQKMEQLSAETAYLEQQLARVIISSSLNGVVLCDNPDEWLGRPVHLGQRIMSIANPDAVELEIYLPPKDTLRVNIGDELLFYSNITPTAPLTAKITFVGYRATEIAGVGMAYTLRAEFATTEKPQLGLRGMAKLYGAPQPLILQLLRLPIMTIRQWLGI